RITGIRPRLGYCDRLFTVRSPGANPEYEMRSYYELPITDGQHVTFDFALARSQAALQSEWKQKPGSPLPCKWNLVTLDDTDPIYNRKAHYEDTLSLRDATGKTLWEKKDLNFRYFGNQVV